VTTHHPWFTVDGGARTYVEKIQECVGAFRLQTAVRQVKEGPGEVKVRTLSGEVLRFDRVIIATHADQALALLDAPDTLQRELLTPFRYQKNHATLHTWPGFLPRRRRAWAAWNFLVEPGPGADSPTRATVHYWMNALQGVSRKKDYFVSLNSQHRIPDGHILYETMYEHPVFTLEAMRAQARLPDLNRRSPRQRVFFCGSYFRHGFHEDAYGSAVDLVQTLRGILASAQPGA
jgi:predicted NAD/FAD-binding protein